MRALIALFLVACAGAPAAPPAETPAPLDLAALTDQPPPGMRYYYLVLLRRGPKWTAEQTEETKKLSAGHMANITRLGREGTLVIAGPFLDAAGPGDLAGIFVFTVRSRADVEALVASDPAVAAGRFTVEIHPWLSGDGLRTAMEVPPTPEIEPKLRCREDPTYREFDFWLGDWDVTTPDGATAGRNHIERGQYGCVLRERWHGARGGTGESLNHRDPVTGEWVQHWVDAQGGVIDLRGGLDAGAMALSGTYLRPDGTTSRMRARWTPLEDGRVKQHIEESTDDGRTWKDWFVGFYARPAGR